LPGSRSGASVRVRLLAVGGLLLLAVGVVFGQTAGFGFVNYDDDKGVYENRLVAGDLSLRNVLAVFTERHAESSAPLTCLSHILVWHLLGQGPALHHLTNILLHAASAVLLLVVLWRMTGRLWPSALVAAVFAVHPLRAESVAWVTERKDVLSGLFFMLTLAAYLGYVRRPFSLGRYLLVLAFFAVSLAAKPMAVTLPFLLLLLDDWPLRRISATKPRSSIAPFAPGATAGLSSSAASTVGQANRDTRAFSVATTARSPIAALWKLIIEKIPLLAIACLFCLVAVHGQEARALEVNQEYSFAWRTGNALISYVAYLGQFFCPVDLAPYYPRRPVLPPWEMAAAALTLAALTAAAIRWRRGPWLLVGWLWYVGMLLPVIGLVQFGAQAEADRFTYLPQIGLAIALVWTAADACRSWPRLRRTGAVAATCGLVILVVSGWRQTFYWHDSEVLWTRTLACTSRNTTAQNNLGIVLAKRGRIDEAIDHYRKALEIEPNHAEAHNNLGLALAGRGRIDEAIDHYQRTLKIDPGDAAAHVNLGLALAGRGRIDEAMSHFQKALDIKPDDAEGHYNLGLALAVRGRMDEAMVHFQRAVDLKPDYAEAHINLGAALAVRGRIDEAIDHYRKALVYAAQQNKTALADELKARLRAYESGTPRPIPQHPSGH
jgi:tetratricopeptide (TPR) repeat protein